TYSGSIFASKDIGARFTNMNLAASGAIMTNGALTMRTTGNNLFDAKISAGVLSTLQSDTTMQSNAQIFASREAGTVSFKGNFAGSMDLAKVTRSLTVGGTLKNGASVQIHGDAAAITLTGGAETNSLVAVEGAARSLTVGGTFAGI